MPGGPVHSPRAYRDVSGYFNNWSFWMARSTKFDQIAPDECKHHRGRFLVHLPASLRRTGLFPSRPRAPCPFCQFVILLKVAWFLLSIPTDAHRPKSKENVVTQSAIDHAGKWKGIQVWAQLQLDCRDRSVCPLAYVATPGGPASTYSQNADSSSKSRRRKPKKLDRSEINKSKEKGLRERAHPALPTLLRLPRTRCMT